MAQLKILLFLNPKEGLVQAELDLLSIFWLFYDYLCALVILFRGLWHGTWDVVEIDSGQGYTKTIAIDVFSSGSSFQFSLDVSLFGFSWTSFKEIDIALQYDEAKVCCVHSIYCAEFFQTSLLSLELHILKVYLNRQSFF